MSSQQRTPAAWWETGLKGAIAVGLGAFQLYTAMFGPLPAMQQRVIHFGLVAAMIFLGASRIRWLGRHPALRVALAVLSLLPAVYLVADYSAIVLRSGITTPLDRVYGVALVVLVLLATLEVVGWPLVLIAVAALLYALLGGYIPGTLGHRGYGIPRLVAQLTLSTEGILGVPLGVAATYIYLFILLGKLLEVSGAGRVVIDAAFALTGRFSGGPAQAAVLSSGLFGTISGSAVANVVTTGTFTIPLMRRTGYRPEIAAAVEAVASSGGQLMPPIMGAAAFVMSEYTGIPYIRIAAAAAIPAILYYLSIAIAVYLEARRTGIRGLSEQELPRLGKTLAGGAHMFLPIVLLVYLLARGFTPMRAGVYALALLVLLCLVRPLERLRPADYVRVFVGAAESARDVAVACASAGIVIGVMTLTGLGTKLSGLVIDMSHGNLLLALVFTMLASLVLGMGLPTVACYLVLAVLVAPALTRMGASVLAAHLFVFYFGIISAITPPVAVAAFAAAGLAGTSAMRTGLVALRLGLAAFIVPYLFVFGPPLLGAAPPLRVAVSFLTACAGVALLAAAVVGWFGRELPLWARGVCLLSAVLLIDPGAVTDLAGAGLGAVTLLLVRWLADRRPAPVDEPGRAEAALSRREG